jgi:hypothetical protein
MDEWKSSANLPNNPFQFGPQVVDFTCQKLADSAAQKHMFFEQSNFRVLGHPIENGHEVREMKIPTSALLARNNFRLAR